LNELLLLASKVAKLADDLQVRNPKLTRAESVQQAFKELKN